MATCGSVPQLGLRIFEADVDKSIPWSPQIRLGDLADRARRALDSLGSRPSHLNDPENMRFGLPLLRAEVVFFPSGLELAWRQSEAFGPVDRKKLRKTFPKNPNDTLPENHKTTLSKKKHQRTV